MAKKRFWSVWRSMGLLMVCLMVAVNVMAPLTGRASILQWPGCWTRDHIHSNQFDMTASDASTAAVYNRPLIARISAIDATQAELKKRLDRLRAERSAFPTLLYTQRFLCVREAGCDPAEIGSETLVTSPVLASTKSLSMLDAELVQTQTDIQDYADLRIRFANELADTRPGQTRLAKFSEMPEACQALLATPQIRRAAQDFGIAVAR